jgi:hypothetical protein
VNVPSGQVKVVPAHVNAIRDHFSSLSGPVHVPFVSSKVHQRLGNGPVGHFRVAVERVNVPLGPVKVLPAHVNVIRDHFYDFGGAGGGGVPSPATVVVMIVVVVVVVVVTGGTTGTSGGSAGAMLVFTGAGAGAVFRSSL